MNSLSRSLLILSVIYLTTIITCANYDKSDQQTRLDACIKIIKARISQDQTNFRDIIDSIALSSSSKEEAGDKLISLALINCYKKISFYDAEEIEDSTKANPFSTTNKENLDLEKWERLFKANNKEEIEAEFAGLEEATNEIKESKLDLSALQQGMRQNNQYDSDQEYDDRMQDIQINREKNMDFSIFGFNFTTLEDSTKYILGFSLIALVFLVVIFGLKWIQKIRGESKWNKKKKKKNE